MVSEVRFTVTDQHLALLRRAWVRWDDVEYGAPAIDSKRPYGNSDVPGDLRAIATAEGWVSTDEELERLHRDTMTALQIALRVGAFAPGEYVARRYFQDWRPE